MSATLRVTPCDAQTSPTGGNCLMGGAREDDNAMRWFLARTPGAGNVEGAG